MKAYNFCNNCGKNGHLFHQCKNPITSIGIITFRITEKIIDISGVTKPKIEFLLIRRKDSLGYVDFLRGKYPLYNKQYLLNILNEMTIGEHKKLLNHDFDILWEELWGEHIGIQYRSEEKNSREKFKTLKDTTNTLGYTLNSLIDELKTNWHEPEWGFPKGRRNYQEKDLSCALREWEEETGYLRSYLAVIQNIFPFEEIFTGSNYKSYKHKYYLAYMKSDKIPEKINFQKSEVSKIGWYSYSDCKKQIRPYNLEKLEVLNRVHKMIEKYSLYS